MRAIRNMFTARKTANTPASNFYPTLSAATRMCAWLATDEGKAEILIGE